MGAWDFCVFGSLGRTGDLGSVGAWKLIENSAILWACEIWRDFALGGM